MLDRVGLCRDLALVMEDESLFPLSKLQIQFSKLNWNVKRKLLIIDGRLISKRGLKFEELTIPEEFADKSPSIFTIIPDIENDNKVVEMDSHPGRTNGFLTGCLIDALKKGSITVEDLPRFE